MTKIDKKLPVNLCFPVFRDDMNNRFLIPGLNNGRIKNEKKLMEFATLFMSNNRVKVEEDLYRTTYDESSDTYEITHVMDEMNVCVPIYLISGPLFDEDSE